MNKLNLSELNSTLIELEDLSKQNFFSDQEIEIIRNNIAKIRQLISESVNEPDEQPVQVEQVQLKPLTEPLDAIKAKYAIKLKELRLDKLKLYKPHMSDEQYAILFTKISESDPLEYQPDFSLFESHQSESNIPSMVQPNQIPKLSREDKLYRIAKHVGTVIKILGKVGVAMQNSYENTNQPRRYQTYKHKQKQKKQRKRKKQTYQTESYIEDNYLEDFRKMGKLWGNG